MNIWNLTRLKPNLWSILCSNARKDLPKRFMISKMSSLRKTLLWRLWNSRTLRQRIVVLCSRPPWFQARMLLLLMKSLRMLSPSLSKSVIDMIWPLIRLKMKVQELRSSMNQKFRKRLKLSRLITPRLPFSSWWVERWSGIELSDKRGW